MLEYSTNYSVGRGTDAPFEQIGSDWIKGPELVRYLTARNIPGVRFYPVQFTPAASNFGGKKIGGVHFLVTDRETFSSSRLGLEVAAALQALYPNRILLEKNRNLIGNSAVMRAVAEGKDPAPAANAGIQQFLELRRKYLLYR